jgi:hypothetical protein
MTKRIVLIFLLVLFARNVSYCQKRVEGSGSILFRGIVLDASTQAVLPGSQIYINRNRTSAGFPDGTFSFYASEKDTIVFSMLGYKPTKMIVSDTLTGSEFLTGVYLETDTLLIGEVIIVPRLTSLKAEMMNPTVAVDSKIENARSNISIVSYQGRTGQSQLGDPAINYEILRKRQRIEAYEKGGIPSDKILGLSPLLLIPAAYLLIHGLPEKPEPPKPQISAKDLEEIRQLFIYSRNKRKQESDTTAPDPAQRSTLVKYSLDNVAGHLRIFF